MEIKLIQERSKKEIKNNFNSHTIIIARASLILTLPLCSCLEMRMGIETEIERERKQDCRGMGRDPAGGPGAGYAAGTQARVGTVIRGLPLPCHL